MPQEQRLWPVERRPPDLLTTWMVAPDLDVAVACHPGGRAVARLPGDRDCARPPWMVEAALGRPGCDGHRCAGRLAMGLSPSIV